MQDLVEDLDVRHQSLAPVDALLEQAPRLRLVRVRGAREVHRDVRVDEDHGRQAP